MMRTWAVPGAVREAFPVPPFHLSQQKGGEYLVHDWMLERAPGWLAEPYLWLHLRLTGTRCYAQGCGRLLLLHTPHQYRRCIDTPLDIELTLRGWLLAKGMEPSQINAWCHANGLDPGAVVHPVVPVSHAPVA